MSSHSSVQQCSSPFLTCFPVSSAKTLRDTAVLLEILAQLRVSDILQAPQMIKLAKAQQPGWEASQRKRFAAHLHRLRALGMPLSRLTSLMQHTALVPVLADHAICRNAHCSICGMIDPPAQCRVPQQPHRRPPLPPGCATLLPGASCHLRRQAAAGHLPQHAPAASVRHLHPAGARRLACGCCWSQKISACCVDGCCHSVDRSPPASCQIQCCTWGSS